MLVVGGRAKLQLASGGCPLWTPPETALKNRSEVNRLHNRLFYAAHLICDFFAMDGTYAGSTNVHGKVSGRV